MRAGRLAWSFGPWSASLEEFWPLAEKLSSIAAGLLSLRRLGPFVRQLFAAAPGLWQTVAECCSALTALPQQAAEVFTGYGDSRIDPGFKNAIRESSCTPSV
jgi:hypothetical protein